MVYKALHDQALAHSSNFLIMPHCMLIQPHWPSFKFSNTPNSLHIRAFAHAILFASTTLFLVFLWVAPPHSSKLTKYDSVFTSLFIFNSLFFIVFFSITIYPPYILAHLHPSSNPTVITLLREAFPVNLRTATPLFQSYYNHNL